MPEERRSSSAAHVRNGLHTWIVVSLTCCFSSLLLHAHENGPTRLMVHLGEIFVTSEADLTTECGRSPFRDLSQTTLISRPISKKEATHIEDEVRLVLRKLVEEQRFFLFESIK